MNEQITDENTAQAPVAEAAPERELAEDMPKAEGEELIDEELLLLRESIPELSGVEDISEALNAERYLELRSLGLSQREAYLATQIKRAPDTRSHLSDSFPRLAKSPHSAMTRSELYAARELFEGLDDSEIFRLYKRVTAK